jgi:hypothetical protein
MKALEQDRFARVVTGKLHEGKDLKALFDRFLVHRHVQHRSV